MSGNTEKKSCYSKLVLSCAQEEEEEGGEEEEEQQQPIPQSSHLEPLAKEQTC